MTDPIKIHAPDTAAEAHRRHADIEARLEELGMHQVGLLLATGGLPTNWNPIIHAWMSGKKLKSAPDAV